MKKRLILFAQGTHYILGSCTRNSFHFGQLLHKELIQFQAVVGIFNHKIYSCFCFLFLQTYEVYQFYTLHMIDLVTTVCGWISYLLFLMTLFTVTYFLIHIGMFDCELIFLWKTCIWETFWCLDFKAFLQIRYTSVITDVFTITS